MSSVIESLERAQLRRIPQFQAGDRVRVHFQVIEGQRRRTQVFEGVVIKRQGHGVRETFTVRKQSFGVGVERTFPVHSPKIEKIEVAARGDVRRAKLYYLRDRVGKRARVRERRYVGPEEVVEAGLLHEETGATDASGMTADEVVEAGEGADSAPAEPDAPNLEAEGVAETPTEEAALAPENPEGDAATSAGQAPEDDGGSQEDDGEAQEAGSSGKDDQADQGAEPKAEGEGAPAPAADPA